MSIFFEALALGVKKATTTVHPALLSILAVAAMVRATPQKTLEAILEYQRQHSVFILPLEIVTDEDVDRLLLSVVRSSISPSSPFTTLKDFIKAVRSIQHLMNFAVENDELYASAFWAYGYFHNVDFNCVISSIVGGSSSSVIYLPDRSKEGV